MPHTHRRSMLVRVLAAALACAGVAACGPRYYAAPEPAAPTALTITAQRRQSQAQQDRDRADCQQMATGQATSSAIWAQMFTACMGGRGYMVQ